MIGNKKIKAGALQFVLFIGAVVAVLLLSFVLVSYSHNVFHKKTDITINLIQASDMGLEYSFQEELQTGETFSIPLENDFSIKTAVTKKFWGIQELRSVVSKKEKLQFEKIAFVGHQSKTRAALYLKDNQRPLVLAGNTQITGTAFLPVRGVKIGNIYGNSYYGSELIHGKQKVSSSSLPKFSKEVQKQIEKLTNPYFEPKGETISLKKEMEFKNSFKTPTKVIKGDFIKLDKNILSGNILIWATQKIVVDAASKLHDVVLLAPEIEIQNWTKGNFQALASKKITVGKGCELLYPSVLLVNASKSHGQAQANFEPVISVDTYSQVRGNIIYVDINEPNTFKPHVHIDEHAKVYGEVHSAQNIELKGSIYGKVTTSSFVALENGNIYQNHLYNGRINSEILPSEYAGIPIQETKSNQVMKWLY